MRRWMLVLLILPGIALACGTAGAAAEDASLDDEQVLERAEMPGTDPPALDLRIDPTQLPSANAKVPPAAPRAIGHPGPDRSPDPAAHVADRGLSVGVEVTPRSRLGSLAREDKAEDPGLQGDLERLMERATLGVRGRYRF